MIVGRILSFLLLVITSPQIVFAQIGANVAGWDVIETDDQTSCVMGQEYEGKGSTYLLYSLGADDESFLSITNYGWSAKEREIYQLKIYFDDNGYDVKALGRESDNGKAGFLIPFKDKDTLLIIDEISKANGLKIYLNDILVDSLSLKGTSAALKWLDKCLSKIKRYKLIADAEKERLAHIPDDPFAFSNNDNNQVKLSAQPVKVVRRRVTSSDYPSEAIKKLHGGKVNALLTINKYGQPTKCKILQSSGFKYLDEHSCKLFSQPLKFRFKPAIDEHGNAIEGEIEQIINWKPPEPDPPAPPPAPEIEIEY